MIQYIGGGAYVPHQGHNGNFGPHGFGQFSGQHGLPAGYGVPTFGGVSSWNQAGLPGGLGLGAFGTPSCGTYTPTIGGSQGNPWSQLGGHQGNLQGNICGGLQGWNGLTQGGVCSPSLATELSETSQDYILSFDVPGIEAQDLSISCSNNTFYLNGTRNESQEPKALAYSEIARGTFSRAITVPFEVTAQKTINTSLENGVLKIRIAKENQCGTTSGARKIKIG